MMAFANCRLPICCGGAREIAPLLPHDLTSLELLGRGEIEVYFCTVCSPHHVRTPEVCISPSEA